MTLRIIVAILATHRLTSLLVYEEWFAWLRTRAGVDFVDDNGNPISLFGRVLSCFWCTSLLVSLPVVLIAMHRAWWMLLPLACSAGVILVNHLTRINLYVER